MTLNPLTYFTAGIIIGMAVTAIYVLIAIKKGRIIIIKTKKF